MKNNFLKYFFVAGIWFLTQQCSVKKNRWINRQYHMLTTQYNILFHGKEKLKEGELLIKQNYRPYYDNILPVFEDEDKNATAVALNNMEEAIDKGLKAISLHSITRKPRRKGGVKSEKYKKFRRKKEYNNLIDECYLLVGKAKFYKGEYKQAEKIFKYLIRNYKENRILAEIELWNIRNFVKQKKFILAEKLLINLLENPDFPNKLTNLALEINADIAIQSRQYKKGIKGLKTLIENENIKAEKAKYYFILAQLHTKLNNPKPAIATFEKAIKIATDYELQFRANLNIIQLTDYRNTDKILKNLMEMLADKNNNDFKDHIYYIIAELYAQEGNNISAVKNYNYAINSYKDNDYQRSLAYIKLANYSFQDKKYAEAKEYYNLAIPFLPNTFPKFETIKKRLQSINELFVHFTTITEEKQLQKIAKPSIEEQKLWAQKIQENNAKQAQKEISEPNVQTTKNQTSQEKIATYQNWYFYNDATKNTGKENFQNIWGVRRLEDNWRRSSKSTFEDEDTFQSSHVIEKNKTRKFIPQKQSIEDLLKTLPTTKVKLLESNNRIKQAYNHIGLLYELDLKDIPKAIRTYKTVFALYPDNASISQAMYMLYNIYYEADILDTAHYYKMHILESFPDSKYAYFIKNKIFTEQQFADKEKVAKLYQEAYKNFRNKSFSNLITICSNAINKYPNTTLKPNFLFLKAIGIGKMQDIEQFKNALENVLSSYPDTDIKSQTEYMLRQLHSKNSPVDSSYFSQIINSIKQNFNLDEEKVEVSKDIVQTIKNPPKKTKQKSKKKKETLPIKVNKTLDIEQAINENKDLKATYIYNENSTHFFVLLISTKQVNVNNLWALINKYDKKYNIDKVAYQKEQKMLVVKSFENKKTATKYLKTIINDDTVYSRLAKVDYRNFIISKKNFDILKKTKALSSYIKFYKKNYLKK